MFRSSEPVSPLDDVVTKATDENLTTENWQFILDVCDEVNNDPENGAKNVISSVTKRLNKKFANTQLYTLTLVISLSSNCGSKMQQAIASKAFVKTLMKLANDSSVHKSVKSKVLEVLQQLTEEYKKDPSLRLIQEAYDELSRKKPDLKAPDKPEKHKITEQERQREEEELQMVLALSLSETGTSGSFQQHHQTPQAAMPPQNNSHFATEEPQQQQQQQQPQVEDPTPTVATVSRVKALYDLNATEPGELSFRKGDIITVLESVFRDWWRGSLRGNVGIFPLNYVMPIAEPTPDEIEKEAQEELSVFSQSRNIEKLLALLSSQDASRLNLAENEELQSLYHSTLAIRPKLVKLIDKYAQRKDDLVELNEKFVKARRVYDDLMEASMPQYGGGAPPNQGQYPPGQYPQGVGAPGGVPGTPGTPGTPGYPPQQSQYGQYSHSQPPYPVQPLQPHSTNQNAPYPVHGRQGSADSGRSRYSQGGQGGQGPTDLHPVPSGGSGYGFPAQHTGQQQQQQQQQQQHTGQQYAPGPSAPPSHDDHAQYGAPGHGAPGHASAPGHGAPSAPHGAPSAPGGYGAPAAPVAPSGPPGYSGAPSAPGGYSAPSAPSGPSAPGGYSAPSAPGAPSGYANAPQASAPARHSPYINGTPTTNLGHQAHSPVSSQAMPIPSSNNLAAPPVQGLYSHGTSPPPPVPNSGPPPSSFYE